MATSGYQIVETTNGQVRGIRYGGLAEFLGVPYGGDVDGPGRFGPPPPVEPWTGVRDALVYGLACPQSDPRLGITDDYLAVLEGLFPGTGHPVESRPQGENCLSLNVWAPAGDEAASSDAKPVMVWLHGGGFVHGTGNEGWSHGAHLARDGDVVVVKVTHRLGLLGFMPTSDSVDDASGVAGMLDIVQALEWVRDNIAAFGGDPSNVTIFGQSGGAMKVSILMAMPAAQPLFHKAVMQSGPGLKAATAEAGEKLLAAVLKALDFGPDEAHRLNDIPAEDLIAVQSRLAEVDPTLNAMAIGPSLHPVHLPTHVADPDYLAAVNGVPLLIGRTSHELAFMMAGDAGFHAMTNEHLPAAFAKQFGDDGPALLEHYQAIERDPLPQLVLAGALTDRAFVPPTNAILEAKSRQAAPVFSYRFDYRPQVFGGRLGAHHTLVIPFTFGSMSYTGLVAESPDRHALSAAMTAAWANFARNGTPSADGLPEWTPWTADTRSTMVLSEAPHIELDRPLHPSLTDAQGLFG